MGDVNPIIAQIDDHTDRLVVQQNELRSTQARVGRGDGGRELALAQTKLDEARFWLAESVKHLLGEGYA